MYTHLNVTVIVLLAFSSSQRADNQDGAFATRDVPWRPIKARPLGRMSDVNCVMEIPFLSEGREIVGVPLASAWPRGRERVDRWTRGPHPRRSRRGLWRVVSHLTRSRRPRHIPRPRKAASDFFGFTSSPWAEHRLLERHRRPTARDAKLRLLKPATSRFYGEQRRSRDECGT
jgi:hypothetical protein